MKREWEHLDINQLQHLYRERSQVLESKLLHGATWKEVSGQRQEVTELATVIYQRLNSNGANPAEKHLRNNFRD